MITGAGDSIGFVREPELIEAGQKTRFVLPAEQAENPVSSHGRAAAARYRQDEAGYLQLAGAMDVLLDTTHFGGGNTTYEAIAAATPVVTLPSPYLRGRLTLGIYKQLGIDDLIAHDADNYAEIAVSLAGDPDKRQELLQRIEERCDLIFEDDRAVTAHEDFFERVITGARKQI